MLKRTCAILALVLAAGWMPSRVHAQQGQIPPPQGNNNQQDDRRPSDYLRYLHGAAHGFAPQQSDEVPRPVVPETTIPPSEFHFNPSEFHPPTTGISEFRTSLGDVGSWFRGGEEALLIGGGGAAAAAGAVALGRREGIEGVGENGRGGEGMTLTGACDACHEPASFENHLAGMTVRCKRCGQGWVRVPPRPAAPRRDAPLPQRDP